MPDLESVGDAVTGGMIGRAVEPKAGEAPGGHPRETNCLNCGAQLVGNYCHRCGQQAQVRRTLTAFFHDFLHGVLHFEGKIWRTLPLLAWKPGELTRRYIDGQRARFISPIALFLFCVFLTYAAVTLFGTTGALPSEAQSDLATELSASRSRLAGLEAERAIAEKRGTDAAKLDEQIAELRGEIAALETARSGGQAIKADTNDDLPEWLSEAVAEGAKNPDLILYKLKTNAYKFSWLIIPLSVPFVWLLFPFSRRFSLYDHTVFVTYSLCFMSLLVVAATLFGSLGLTAIAGLLWLVPPFHIYRQLKGTYGLTFWSAVWRTVILTAFAMVVIGWFAALIVGIGLFA